MTIWFQFIMFAFAGSRWWKIALAWGRRATLCNRAALAAVEKSIFVVVGAGRKHEAVQ